MVEELINKGSNKKMVVNLTKFEVQIYDFLNTIDYQYVGVSNFKC